MDYEMPVVAEPSAGHHHQDAGALANGDPFALMPPIWPLLFGDPAGGPAVVHLTADAPPLAFRPLAEYRVLCGFTPLADLAETVTYILGASVGAVFDVGAGVDAGAATLTGCAACRTAHEHLVDNAITTARGEVGR